MVSMACVMSMFERQDFPYPSTPFFPMMVLILAPNNEDKRAKY